MAHPHISVVRRTISTPILLSLVLVALAVLALAVGSRPFNQTIIDVLIRVMLVVGVYIFVGNSGVISFGQIGFTCLGAYFQAWFTLPPPMKTMSLPGLPGWLHALQWPWWVVVPLAGLFAAVIALAFGKVLMRLSGIAASIATFAMLAVINVVYSNWTSVTAATSSVVGIPIMRTIWPYLLGAIAAVFIGWAYAISRSGLALRASREEPVAAAASGVDIPRERLRAFVVSAFVMGAAGGFFAHSIGVVTPDTFYLALTFTTLSMLVVGGMFSLTGAVLGVVVLSAMIELLRMLEKGVSLGGVSLSLPTGIQEIAIGVIMVVILMFRPMGLFGRREWRWRKTTARPANGARQ